MIIKCLFWAAGCGMRFLSATKATPKEMFPVLTKSLTPDIFDILRTTQPGRGGEIQITDALLQQAKQGKVIAYKFQGKRFDCGSVEGFVEATNWFYGENK